MQRQQHVPASVYLLADHLDAALAICEDLLRLIRQPPEPTQLRSMRRLDLAAMLHLLRARHHTETLRHADRRLSKEGGRFLAATETLQDAAKEVGKHSASYRDMPCDVSAESTHGSVHLAVSVVPEEFRVAGRLPLGTVGDLVADLLDALERHYVLFDNAEPKSVELPMLRRVRHNPSSAAVKRHATRRGSSQNTMNERERWSAPLNEMLS